MSFCQKVQNLLVILLLFFGFASMGELLRNARHAKPSVKPRNDEAGAFLWIATIEAIAESRNDGITQDSTQNARISQ